MYWMMPVIMKLFMVNYSIVAYAYLHYIKKLINWCYAEVSADFSGGSAGENTRLSQENPTPLSNTNPTPLSNEAVAVGKNDESFEGESKFSIDFFLTKSLPFLSEVTKLGQDQSPLFFCHCHHQRHSLFLSFPLFFL